MTDLFDLAGVWAGGETLAPSPWSPGGRAHGRHVLSPALDGKALIHDYVEERDGVVALTGHAVWMREPDSGGVLWFWFDSIGFPPAGPSRGAFDGPTLTL